MIYLQNNINYEGNQTFRMSQIGNDQKLNNRLIVTNNNNNRLSTNRLVTTKQIYVDPSPKQMNRNYK